MKLNYRDKVILGIILAIAILLAGFFLLIKPKNQEIKDDKASLETLELQKEETESKIREIEPLKQDIEEIYKDTTKLTDDFVEYNDINNPRKLDQYMQHFAEECNVKIMNLSSGSLNSGTLDYYYFTPSYLAEDQLSQADLNGDKQANIANEKAESDALAARTKESVLLGQYTVTVRGTKEDIYSYLQAIEDQSETIIINSVTLTDVEVGDKKEGDKDEKEIESVNDLPQANIAISIYSVYNLSKPNTDAD